MILDLKRIVPRSAAILGLAISACGGVQAPSVEGGGSSACDEVEVAEDDHANVKISSGELSLSQQCVDFGSHDTAQQVLLTLSNDSGTDIEDVLYNALSAPFSISFNGCPPDLTNGMSCLIQLSFDAPSINPGMTHTSAFSITYPGGALLTKVTGSRPSASGLQLSPTAWDFGLQSTNVTKTFTLTNLTGAALTGITLNNPGTWYEEVGGSRPTTLPIGGTNTYVIVFKAGIAPSGTHTGAFTVTSSAGSATVTLTGQK
jgi:hypothetical protein